jgi:hypothetical protein
MQGVQNKNSIGHLSVLTALWFINILVLIFGSPFLIYKKTRGFFSRTTKRSKPEENLKQKSTRYFPCRIDSNL